MRRPAVAIVCLALGALAGCSEPQPSASPEPEDSVVVTSDSAEPDDAAGTSSPPDVRGEDPGVPELPPEATEDSVAGAEAFVRYYIDLINYTAEFPTSGVLNVYSDPGCGTCEVFEEEVAQLEQDQQYYDAETAVPLEMQTIQFQGDSQVTVRSSAPATNKRGNSGQILEELDPVDEFFWLVEISPRNESYVVKGISNVD